MLRAYGGTLPRVHPTASIGRNAPVTADVECDAVTGVGLNVVLRRDAGWTRTSAGRWVPCRFDDVQA